MTKREVEKLLKKAGFKKHSGRRHDVWTNRVFRPFLPTVTKAIFHWHIKKYFKNRWIGERNMKSYYALFRKTPEAIEVEFPDLQGCVTFGRTKDEAMESAGDVLAGWLANAEPQFVKEPSSYEDLKSKFSDVELIPVAVDEQIMQYYEASKRFNVVFPANLLNQVDRFSKEKGLKRSIVLRKATEEYLQKQTVEA